MSSQPGAAAASPQQQQLLKEIREAVDDLRKTKIDFSRADVRIAVEYNREASTFYEKVCLVNGGTLALSLSLLGSALQYGAGHHLPRSAFLWLVVPGWALLLFSTHFCALRIVGTHNMNAKLLERSGSETNEFYYSVLKDITQRMTNLNLEELKNILQERVTEIDQHITQQTALMASKIEEAKKQHERTATISRLAFGFTIIGIVLLCTFAVRVLLAL